MTLAEVRFCPFFTVTGVRRGRKLSGVKPPNFGVLCGWARAAENIMIAWEYLVPKCPTEG